MRYFSGFCFSNEREIFSHLPLTQDLFSVTGFSYGAINAFRYALKSVKEGKRIQTLNLLSPAFFQTQSPSFIKMQLLGFRKDAQNYIQNFLSLCGYHKKQLFKAGSLEELQDLLTYQWRKEEIEELLSYGVKINVFLGGEDKIIPPLEVREFFLPYSIVYFYKSFNHCLNYDRL